MSACIVSKTIREPAAVHRPEVLKAPRGTNIQDSRAMRRMSPPHREVSTGMSVGELLPHRGLVSGRTYREISNNGFRVICSEREGENFQKR